MYKIGQLLKLQKTMEIGSTFNGDVIKTHRGDKAVVTSKGSLLFLSGNAKGCITLPSDVEVKGYDVGCIAKVIIDRVNSVLWAYLDDEVKKEVLGYIGDEVSEYLEKIF